MKDRVILHCDLNNFYASVETLLHPELQGKPVAVCGDPEKRHGIVLAKSQPAKVCGVKTGEPLFQAMQKCPDLRVVPPDYALYVGASRKFIAVLREMTPLVEQYSIDEAFVDMTETTNLWGDPLTAATRLKNQIRDSLGFTVNIGISENKLLAKMASDFQKPDRIHSLWKKEIPDKMWPLPVSDLFFVGKATTKKLLDLGIRSIGDLAHSDPALLKAHLKKHGEVIWAFSNGLDVSVVQSKPPENKGYGNSCTIPFDVTDSSTAKLVLLALAETVGSRLRTAKVKAEVIAVGIKTYDLRYASHQMILSSATNITSEIHNYACRLFDELWDGTGIRHLGIHSSRIRDGFNMRQLNMFETIDYEKLEKMDATVDRIRARYGIDSIMRASFLGSSIDHMSGGISREKRSVNYEKIIVK